MRLTLINEGCHLAVQPPTSVCPADNGTSHRILLLLLLLFQLLLLLLLLLLLIEASSRWMAVGGVVTRLESHVTDRS